MAVPQQTTNIFAGAQSFLCPMKKDVLHSPTYSSACDSVTEEEKIRKKGQSSSWLPYRPSQVKIHAALRLQIT